MTSWIRLPFMDEGGVHDKTKADFIFGKLLANSCKVRVTSPCMVITCSKSKDQPVEVANPARGQLNKKIGFLPLPVRA